MSIQVAHFNAAYLRLVAILEALCRGGLDVSEESDTLYVELLQLCHNLLGLAGFEELKEFFPSEIPLSLFTFNNRSTPECAEVLKAATGFRAHVNRFRIAQGEPQDDPLLNRFFVKQDEVLHKLSITIVEGQRTRVQSENRIQEIQSALFPLEIVKDTRRYIFQVALEANGCYANGWYNASAIMLRRLIETLLIECFVSHHLEDKIKNSEGKTVPLEDVIKKFLAEPTFRLGRDAKKTLTDSKWKSLGNNAAHNARFLARQADLSNIALETRILIQELVLNAFDKGGTNDT